MNARQVGAVVLIVLGTLIAVSVLGGLLYGFLSMIAEGYSH